MDEGRYRIYFLDLDGVLLGDWPELLPIPLREGMKITLHNHSREYEVVDWNFHFGQPEEQTGLRIILDISSK